MKKLFLIIGAPGSGKTTDAQMIATKHDNITHYSTGDMLRAEVATGSELGKILEKFMSAGEIVPIKIVIKTIINAIKNAPTDIIIIDGYPRSFEQRDALEEYLKNDNTVQLINVIEITVSEAVARERVLGRARGDDDNDEVFNNRMKIYIEPLAGIQEFYSKQGLLHKIDGERGIEEIVQELDNFIQTKIN